jgi:small GTP-binding protein
MEEISKEFNENDISPIKTKEENENIDDCKDLIDRDSYSTNKDSQNGTKNDRIPTDINFNNLLFKNKNYKIEKLEEHHKNFDLNFKIIVIGNVGVGKSCLSLKATKGIFIEEYTSTVGFEFYCFNVKINDKIVKLQIWDTCGQEAYRSLIMNFYRNASLAIIVYSIEDLESFKDINIWLKQVRTYGSTSCKVFLIGNKIDSNSREVSYEQGLKCKNDFFFDGFMETSAKDGINTRELFVNCATILYEENEHLNEQLKSRKYSDDSESARFSIAKDIYYEEVDQCSC